MLYLAVLQEARKCLIHPSIFCAAYPTQVLRELSARTQDMVPRHWIPQSLTSHTTHHTLCSIQRCQLAYKAFLSYERGVQRINSQRIHFTYTHTQRTEVEKVMFQIMLILLFSTVSCFSLANLVLKSGNLPSHAWVKMANITRKYKLIFISVICWIWTLIHQNINVTQSL